MSQLITELFSAFGETIKGMTGGIKDAFSSLLYVDAAATEPVLTSLAIFIFVMIGLGLALGVVKMIFSFVKNRG